ncbi:MAG: hypothetical protein ACR652_08705 [Methylocystis sp.]|uniref:hypothetical protein n=1 Tax=Methylocystis sp. TaxID=1911079 RepID=UPI003DA38845
MAESEPIEVEAFYRYGHKGREMVAIRAPIAMADASDFIGRIVRLGDGAHAVRAVARQGSGPIRKGEPMGIDIGAL